MHHSTKVPILWSCWLPSGSFRLTVVQKYFYKFSETFNLIGLIFVPRFMTFVYDLIYWLLFSLYFHVVLFEFILHTM